MLKESIKFADSNIFEGMTSIRAVIRSIDNGISDRKIERIYFDRDKMQKIKKEIGYFKAVSGKYGFELIEADAPSLNELTLGNSHGGIVAACSERTLPYLDLESDIQRNGFYVMLQGIEDPYNFGYSLRSLYAMGCSGIILDERNWMSAAGVVCRSSAGASEMFRMYKSEPTAAIELFKEMGYTCVCAEEKTENILGKCPLKYPIFLIVGGEKRGISRSVLEKCDIKVKIPYSAEFSASLSAASATTMFAYEIMRQNSEE